MPEMIEDLTEIGYVKCQPIRCCLSISLDLWQTYLNIYIGPLESLEAFKEHVHHSSSVFSLPYNFSN
jgi:hypothetical protein